MTENSSRDGATKEDGPEVLNQIKELLHTSKESRDAGMTEQLAVKPQVKSSLRDCQSDTCTYIALLPFLLLECELSE